MTNVPITINVDENELNTKEKVNIKQIKISSDYKIYYTNDLAIFNIVFKKNTNLSLDVLVSLSNKKIETLEEYRCAVQCYIITFSQMILKKIPIEWNEFKNYLSCQVPFENSLIDININVKEEYKPNEVYETAKEKFIFINNKAPEEKWNDKLNQLTSLDLGFEGFVRK